MAPRVMALASLLLVGAAFALVQARWWFMFQRELHPPKRPIAAEERQRAKEAFPHLEEVTFTARDGLRLAGWFCSGPRKDGIALVHGLGSNRAFFLETARLLVERGHGVLLYDSRASGASEGGTTTWGDTERLDVQAALDYLSGREEVRRDRLGLYGFSVGATAVALVAARDSRVAATALGPTWTSLREELRDKHGKWGPLALIPAYWAFRRAGVAIDALRPIDVIAAIPPRQLLLLSGDQDTDTPPAVMRRLHERVPGSEYWLVPGVGHEPLERRDPDAFARHFCGFFDRAFPFER